MSKCGVLYKPHIIFFIINWGLVVSTSTEVIPPKNLYMVGGSPVKENREALIEKVNSVCRYYPTLIEGIENLIDLTVGHGNELLVLCRSAKVYSFTLEQRGKRYLVSCDSNIRGTYGYETLSYHLLRDDPAANLEDNPNMELSFITTTLEEPILLKPR